MFNIFKLAVVLLITGTTSASAQTAAGLLSCNTSDQAGTVLRLDCTLQSTSGATSRFEGSLRTPLPLDIADRRVFRWAVTAPRGSQPSDLEGRYRRQATDSDRSSLTGGKDNTVFLQPPVGKDQLPGPAMPATLELDLRAVKT